MAYRNSPEVKEAIKNVGYIVKNFKESESESDPDERKKFNRRQNRMLRYSTGHLDFALQSKGALGANTYLEDLITPTAGLSPGGRHRDSFGYIILAFGFHYLFRWFS